MRPHRSNLRQTANPRAGYTLAEILIALGVFGFAMTGALGLLMQSASVYKYDAGRLRVNNDIRAVTSEMADNATYANQFLIFPSYVDRSAQVNDGLSGDFLVLVYRDPDDQSKIERLVGYYRAPGNSEDPASEGPVREFDKAISPSSASPILDLLPPTSTINDHRQVVELSRGLSNGKLFYNFYDRSIMIKGELIEDAANTRRATSTYNFTVSPRG